MPTKFDKAAIPENLEQIKTLIDERATLVEEQKAIKKAAVDSADAIINEAESEMKALRIKAAEMLGIPSKLTPEEGKVPTHREREEGDKPKEEGGKEGVQ